MKSLAGQVHTSGLPSACEPVRIVFSKHHAPHLPPSPVSRMECFFQAEPLRVLPDFAPLQCRVQEGQEEHTLLIKSVTWLVSSRQPFLSNSITTVKARRLQL